MELNWHDLFLLAIPGLIAIITKPDWSGTVKYFVAISLCGLAAVAEIYLSGGSTFSAIAKAFLITFASYAGIWKPLGLADKVETKVNG